MSMNLVRTVAKRLACLLLACVALSGCMSIATLSDDGIYRGVRGDIDQMLSAQDETRGIEIFCLLDLPLSLALDTVLLPFQLVEALTDSSEEDE